MWHTARLPDRSSPRKIDYRPAAAGRSSKLTGAGNPPAPHGTTEKADRMKHWNFNSTDAEFDGARIQRECRAAGLEIVAIRRRKKTVTLATREYYERLVRADVKFGLQAAHVGYGLELLLDQKGEMYVCGGIPDQHAETERYCYSLYGTGEPDKLHEELLKAEARVTRTTVVGYP